MSARATINVVSAVADKGITTEVASSTTYVAAEASAYIDENSGNQWVYEIVPLNDLVVQILNKSLSDSATLGDTSSFSFSKYDTETLALVESFARVVSYNRSFTDAFTLDDLSQIDKDFYGNKGNITWITDIIGLSHEKMVSETLTLAEIITVTLTYLRDFTDSTTMLDSAVHSFEKAVTDSLSLDDAALINKDYVGYKGNSFGFTEALAAGISKGVVDTLVFSEDLGLHPSKGINDSADTISISDLVSIANISGRVLNGASFNTTTLN
ncbi:MAG: hypothetical protein H8D23_11740 [Candidatus Brocadiales bacterium]|nr:hypothetical protein [Candidatus Brocadiales bacterium]